MATEIGGHFPCPSSLDLFFVFLLDLIDLYYFRFLHDRFRGDVVIDVPGADVGKAISAASSGSSASISTVAVSTRFSRHSQTWRSLTR
jgi:hypothetical protein